MTTTNGTTVEPVEPVEVTLTVEHVAGDEYSVVERWSNSPKEIKRAVVTGKIMATVAAMVITEALQEAYPTSLTGTNPKLELLIGFDQPGATEERDGPAMDAARDALDDIFTCLVEQVLPSPETQATYEMIQDLRSSLNDGFDRKQKGWIPSPITNRELGTILNHPPDPMIQAKIEADRGGWASFEWEAISPGNFEGDADNHFFTMRHGSEDEDNKIEDCELCKGIVEMQYRDDRRSTGEPGQG